MLKVFLFLFSFMVAGAVQAQRLPDHIYMEGIRTVKLFQQNNQQGMAVWNLGSRELLELHFDDMSGSPKNYYYTLQLCNADWTPANLNVFDYINGFTQNRLSQYRVSSIANSKYVHYQALLPERNCVPSKSGNYMLKVYLDGDTAKLAFTQRLLVLDTKVLIGARVMSPFDNTLSRTHQKIHLSVNSQKLNILGPQQTYVVILQNRRWDDAVKNIQPSFIHGNVMEYNGERDCVFPAGKEYRWADLRSFRFVSDRMDRVDKSEIPNHVYIKPDVERNSLRYLFFEDRNGWDEISTTEFVNPWWQGDYAYVHFTFTPAQNRPFTGKDVYWLGQATGNQVGDTSKMEYDATLGVYKKTMLLKQGYYSYTYVTKDTRNPDAKADPALTDGNYWETENEYTILFYHRPFSARHDELMGIATVNSRVLR